MHPPPPFRRAEVGSGLITAKFVDRYTGAEHVDWQLSRLAHRGAVKMLVVSETNLVSVKRCHADARQKLDASGDRANT